jgi:hypothetical protein
MLISTVNKKPFMNKTINAIFLGFLVIIIASCSTTTTKFTKYQGNDIMLGHGGVERSVDGIDIWTYGSPDQKFKIIGVVDDSPKQGNGFMNRMKLLSAKSLDSQLVSAAKAHGGNAVIIIMADNDRDIFGDSGSGPDLDGGADLSSENSNGGASTRHGHSTKAYIIKYVDAGN